MDKMIRVRVKSGIVSAKLLENRPSTVLVELPDGNRIVRKKKRDVVPDEATTT